MRGLGRGLSFLAGLMLFAACTFGAGSTSPTAQVSPESSPSSVTSNPAQTAAPAATPSVVPSPSAAGLAITSTPIHNGEVGVTYLAVSFSATGGTAPYTWSVADGSVPPGLTLSPGGIFTGNDTAAGTFSFDAKVTDSGGQAATAKVSLRGFRSEEHTAQT